MATYDDDVVTLDDTGITIKNYTLPGRPRHIRYNDIVHAEVIPLSFVAGRHQLVGIGPFRPRHFFHWDRKRSAKSHGLSLDLGRWLRLAISPDDPDQVLAILRKRTLSPQT
ncbi:MAG: hypothetical protein ACI8TP_001868 [Acidimicrobiales bacterium]|jgi:hypothetical protein